MLKFIQNHRKKTIIILGIIVIICTLFLIKNMFKPDLEKTKDSVVMIEVYDNENKLLGTGSGFCVYDSHYIATNFHVIEGGNKFKIITDDKKTFDVTEIVIFDSKNDLAIIKTTAKLKPLQLGNSRSLKAGNKVSAIGSPKGELNTVSTGVISNADDDKYLRITAPISPGSSGGVLLDKNNKVIGITTAVYNSEDAQNINYAVSLEYLKDLNKAYKREKYHVIKDYIEEGCMINSDNITSFDSCLSSDYDYYTAESLDIFYDTTNSLKRYGYSMIISDWSDVYTDLNLSDIEKATAYYKELSKINFCYDECDIIKDIEKWDRTEFMINLEVLSKEELAFVIADLENYKYDDDKFDRVEEYPLEAYQKALILYLIGDRSWYNIHKDNKEEIFDFFAERDYETKELGAILELLGYEVVYEGNDDLTAYW